MSEPKTLQEAILYYSDPDNCLRKMVEKRWPDGVVICPNCGSKSVKFNASRRVWQCSSHHAKRQFSVKVGTIFEDSAIGLDKWLTAMWMIANDKNGISSYEIARGLGVTQKTGWFMAHRIRLALQDVDGGKLGGEVEVDETFIGGLSRNMHVAKRREKIMGTGGRDKVAVLGILKRKGKVKTSILPNLKRKSLHAKVYGEVEPGTQVFTDAYTAYTGLSADYVHNVIDHAKAYAIENVHTNGLENYWSLLKRTIKGTYVSVEPFHLFRYLDEQAFRYNNRQGMNDGDRFEMALTQVIGKRLTWQKLTGKVPETGTQAN